MARLAHALTNKLIHAPTAALRQAGHDDETALSEAIGRLFNLKEGNDT